MSSRALIVSAAVALAVVVLGGIGALIALQPAGVSVGASGAPGSTSVAGVGAPGASAAAGGGALSSGAGSGSGAEPSGAASSAGLSASAGPSPSAEPSSSAAPAPLGSAPGASPSDAQPPAAPSGPPASPAASPSASQSASPAASLVPAPLTGVLVPPNVAARHVIAVMIDDLSPARPQSGLTAASVVWQAPAEGGIPRYMLLFQDGVPGAVGPVRSARYYFIGWAAEWRAAYAHAGGSPQALSTLRAQGRGQLVYNLDQFSYSSTYFWRIAARYAPHNLYTDGQRLRQMANGVGARSGTTPPAPAWTFGPEAAYEDRPTGGSIETWYAANHIRYTYDRATNTYPRWVSPGVKQVDASTGKRVAPKNVVIMVVRFGALNDSHPEKGRLEADFIGSGKAWVATNGRTVAARWVKTSITAPTRFVDAKGKPITLTPGQTFVQVMPTGAYIAIADGKPPAPHAPPAHVWRAQ